MNKYMTKNTRSNLLTYIKTTIMKRGLFSLVLLMVVSFAFAQQKSVREAKTIAGDVKPDLKKAESLINEALKNPETSNDAATWDVAGIVQKRIIEEEMKNAYLQKPFDTLKAYNSILKMYEYFIKCDELAEVPDAKGKVKNKYRKANAASMLAERNNLINGGIEYFNVRQPENALKFFGTYVDAASYPILAKENIAVTDTMLPQIAYYAVLAANDSENPTAIIKYAPFAVKSKNKEEAATALQVWSSALKDQGNTDAWIAKLQEGIVTFPDNQYFFANLIDHYSSSNQPEKAMEFADSMLAKEPNNKLYLYVKAYLLHNMNNYDEAIKYYTKAIEADPEYAEAYSNLGLIYIMKAQEAADADAVDLSNTSGQEAAKANYKEAKTYLEKARQLRPEQKDLWAPGLYRVYYNLNMEPEFLEIESVM